MPSQTLENGLGLAPGPSFASLERIIPMCANGRPALQTFIVTVTFFSGNELFASERYTIDAATWYRAEQTALEMSVSSPYDDSRVPDLHREVLSQSG